MIGRTPVAVGRSDVAGRVWRRAGIWAPGAEPDTTTDVGWLQLDSWYCDLRRPADLPAVTARSLAELTRADLLALAGQEAFAGRLQQQGEVWTWTRVVDLHPPEPLPDAGRLALDGDVLVETGVGRDYLERWVADTPPDTGPRQELVLRGADGRAGLLLRLGDRFGHVRDRAAPLPGGAPLRELVGPGTDLDTARALIDLEVSLGVVVDGDWRITRSTLPFRVGCSLQPEWAGGTALTTTALTTTALTTTDVTAQGRPARRRWAVVPSHA
ncbi:MULTISPECIES: hypothetical protein [unclassified Modestobacter]